MWRNRIVQFKVRFKVTNILSADVDKNRRRAGSLLNLIFIVISRSIHPSFRPRSLVWSLSSFPLFQSGSNLTHRVLLSKACAVTLNEVSWSKVNIITELCEKSLSGSYILFPPTNLAHTSSTECLWSMDVQWSWMKFLGQDSRSYQITNFFLEHINSPLSYLAHTSNKQSFWIKGLQWLLSKFQGQKVIADLLF